VTFDALRASNNFLLREANISFLKFGKALNSVGKFGYFSAQENRQNSLRF